jgi:cadherin 7 type 2
LKFKKDVPPVSEIDGLKAQRPHNTDVGDFINSKLREIDNDPVQPPYDSLQEYAYEGEGSMYGSTLSSLDTILQDEKPTSNTSTFKTKNDIEDGMDSELDQLKNWGPKFNKISNIYGLKSKEEES